MMLIAARWKLSRQISPKVIKSRSPIKPLTIAVSAIIAVLLKWFYRILPKLQCLQPCQLICPSWLISMYLARLFMVLTVLPNLSSKSL